MTCYVTTSLFAIRLHSVGKLSLNTSLTIMCLHLTKLSLFYPCEHSLSMLTSTVLPLCSTFLTSFVLLRLFVFDHTPFLRWSQLLAYSGLLLVGLLLSVDTFLSPMWASLTHTLPTGASQLGECGICCIRVLVDRNGLRILADAYI